MRYMMLIHHDEADLAAAPKKELWADYAAFNEALHKAGAGMASGERLQPSAAATTVRQQDGKTDVAGAEDALGDAFAAALRIYARSPMVALNRAVALAEAEGPDAALTATAPLAEDRRMLGYQPYWALGSICRRGLGTQRRPPRRSRWRSG